MLHFYMLLRELPFVRPSSSGYLVSFFRANYSAIRCNALVLFASAVFGARAALQNILIPSDKVRCTWVGLSRYLLTYIQEGLE